ncbi:uncharacterized protein LOC123561778 isoform X2 [Mercenaria mercenaria]|uniref:uncharacterized protein LOC123561778 isoform X2 n=1 Tax=Mercenaria mercenaria TaxID=6596 RepID=UPI00234F992E|nr:uncharacterized protein LOC123561778 isoform X2 [Mercenaria mercenaria]
MNKAGLFLFSLTCLVGVVLGAGKTGGFLPQYKGNPYAQAAVPLRPPIFPPPIYGVGGGVGGGYGYGVGGGYGYGAFGYGRRIGLRGTIFACLGFFLILLFLMMGFGFLATAGRYVGGSGKVNHGGAAKGRQVIVVHDNGVDTTYG